MKKLVIITSLLLCSWMAKAGPFISGGTGMHVQCEDEKLQLSATVTPNSGAGTLNGSDAGSVVELDCKAVSQAVPSMADTTLNITCSTPEGEPSVQVYKNLRSATVWAIVYEETRNGVPAPHSLHCTANF